MSVEGFWSVEFIADTGDSGAGVVVFLSGRIFGGDSQYYYGGAYNISGDTITVRADIHHFAGPMESIFGSMRSFSLDIIGNVQNGEISASGAIVSESDRALALRLRKLADLP